MLNSGEEIWDEMEAAPDPHYIESALSNFQTEVNLTIEYLNNPGFFLTPAAEKTKTQAENSSQKLKEKTQPQGGIFLL